MYALSTPVSQNAEQEKRATPTVTLEARVVAGGKDVENSWSHAVAAAPGDAVQLRATGTMPSLINQFGAYEYRLVCACPVGCVLDPSSVHVVAHGVTQAAGKTRAVAPTGDADITDLFTVSSKDGVFTIGTADVLQAAGLTKDSTIELTCSVRVAKDIAPDDYALYAHAEYAEKPGSTVLGSSVEDAVVIKVQAADVPGNDTQKSDSSVAAPGALSHLSMPSTGDAVLAGTLSVGAAGLITLLVGLLGRRRKAQEQEPHAA